MNDLVLQAGTKGNRSAGALWLSTNSCSNVVKSIDFVTATPLMSLFPMTATDSLKNGGATQQPAVQREFGRTIPDGSDGWGKYSICEGKFIQPSIFFLYKIFAITLNIKLLIFHFPKALSNFIFYFLKNELHR